MGNTGRPSTGCSRCRKRRIKCDERKPGCVRCEKVGEACPGYQHGFWIFRDENDIAKRRVLKHARQADAAENGKDDSDGIINVDTTTVSQQLVQNPNRMPDNHAEASLLQDALSIDAEDVFQVPFKLGLVPDLEFRSICLFMENFTLDASTEGNDPAFLDFLPAMYMSTKTDSSLRKAVTAVALNNFANRYRANTVASDAQIAYGNALAATNRALRDPATATSDSVLAAVFLLSLYELLCRPDVPTLGGVAWTNHIFGTLQLLRLRWKQQLKTTTERHLFQLVHQSVLIAHIMSYIPPPADSMGFILTQEYPEGLGAKIAAVFFCKVVELRAKIHQAVMTTVRGSSPESELLSAVLTEADALIRSQSLANWIANEPHWQIQEYLSTNNTKTGKHAFKSHAIAHMWIYHWTAQICLRKSMLDGYFALEVTEIQFEERSEADEKIASLKTGIEGYADKILGAVDYSLRGAPLRSSGEIYHAEQPRPFEIGSSVGALQLFWPLGVIKHAPFTTSMQKGIASDVLRRIGTELSIAQALLHVH